MKRASYMLMSRLNKMGLTILSGNFSKIIVGTAQFTYHEAFSNINNILNKCVEENQKVFKFVKLTPTNIYKCLLFKDPFNYVGMAQTDETES